MGMEMSVRTALLTGPLIALCGAVLAADDEVPDGEFLEYLGLWEASDEEWLIFADVDKADKEEQSEPVARGEESPEKDDES